MFSILPWTIQRIITSIRSSETRVGLHPIPGTKPLTIEAALLPPLLYYVALLFLPSSPPPSADSRALRLLRNILAAAAAILFFRLPLAYHVSQSIGLTYQLGLVGLYGGCRIVDAFFISVYLFNHVPKRVRYTHIERPYAEPEMDKEWTDGGVKNPFLAKEDTVSVVNSSDEPTVQTFRHGHPDSGLTSSSLSSSSSSSSLSMLTRVMSVSEPRPVYETAHTEQDHPTTFLERASWALELELSMRGIGFTWTTADVRHTRKTWLPTVSNRIHSILTHVLPVLVGGYAIIRGVYVTYLASEPDLFMSKQGQELFDANIPYGVQIVLTLAMGAFLMAAFSLGHSLFAIMCAPLAPSPLAFFPALYSIRVWRLTTVRKFWSYGWHRLFARLFLVYGVWPGEWVERKLTGKRRDQPADVGKVLGAFLSSAFVHSFSVRGVLAGDWKAASGEAKFFTLNGLAIVIEEGFQRYIKRYRKYRGWAETLWYDAWVGRVWWITVLLVTGRNFARGWVKSGLVREMAFM